jgi:hypothetical protein
MTDGQSKTTEIEMNFHAPVANVIGKSEGPVFVQAVEQKQILAEVANNIQKLLRQLEVTKPQATEQEKIFYVNSGTSVTLKERAISALKGGGESAIDEFILENKYLKVAKAIAKGWVDPS